MSYVRVTQVHPQPTLYNEANTIMRDLVSSYMAEDGYIYQGFGSTREGAIVKVGLWRDADAANAAAM